MLRIFFFLAVMCCVVRYLMVDPMKRMFFLVFALLIRVPLISFFIHVWFSYFICLLFLRGIFVILVYFSRLSKVERYNKPFAFVVGVLSFFYFYPFLFFYFGKISVNNFYYDVYWFFILFLIFILLFFINFTRYFLNFVGALRKI